MSCLDENLVVDLLRGRTAGQPLADAEKHLAECDACTQLFANAAGALSLPESDVFAGDLAGLPADSSADLANDLPARTTLRPLDGHRTASIGDDRDHGSLAPGTPLNDTYRVIRFIGHGGMGEVYEVAHARLSGRYAAKVLTSQIATTDEIVSRFRREAHITSALRHPNIVQVIDFNWTSHRRPFLVMEYLEGAHLGRIIQAEGPMSLARVLQIVGPIVSALVAVHRSGVIHRDLKPQNIMLVPSPDGAGDVVKLLDFGLSKRTGVNAAESLLVSRERMLVGTPLYMAPEQARGDSENIGSAADQFALAAIIYEMLTRRAAFAGNCLENVLYRIAHTEPGPMSELVADLPVGVDLAVRRALRKDVAARFPSIGAFFDAFRDAAGAPVLAGGDSKAGAVGAQLGTTSKDLTGEAVAASLRQPMPRGRGAAWIGLVLAVSLVVFLLAGKRLRPHVSAHLSDAAGASPVAGVPVSNHRESPPSLEEIRVAPPAGNETATVNKTKASGRHARGQTQRVVPRSSPAAAVPDPDPAPPPSALPPEPRAIEATPPAPASRPKVGGFTRL